MNAQKALAAESTLTIGATVFGDLVRQQDRTLPRPKKILGWLMFFSLLSILAAFGQGPARLAAAVGGLATLVSMVSGVAGQDLIQLLSSAARSSSSGPGEDAPPGVKVPPWAAGIGASVGGRAGQPATGGGPVSGGVGGQAQ